MSEDINKEFKQEFSINTEHNLGKFGVACSFVDCYESPQGFTFLYKLKDLNDYDKNKIEKAIEKLTLLEQVDLRYIDKPQGAHFGVFYPFRFDSLDLGDCLAETGLYKWILGKDMQNNYVELDLRKIPHLLIGGTTGSGKSVLIHNLIFNILNCYTNKKDQGWFELYIIDTKRGMKIYQGVKNTTFVWETSKAIKLLNDIVSGMDAIYHGKVVEQHKCDRFIIIDELADLMLTSKYEVEQALVRIAQLGREMGLHLIVATQNPKVEVCTGLIKANMPDRITLRVASTRESVVMLDHKGAEQLEGQGDCILKLNGKETRCLVAMPSEYDKSKLINFCKG